MKNTIILAVMLLIGTVAMGTQSLTIINNTSCPYNVWMSAHVGTNTCGSLVSKTIGVAPMSTVTFANPADFESSIGWSSGGSIGAGFLWDYARVYSGFWVVGSSTCVNISTRPATNCSPTGSITYATYSFGNVTITINP